MDAKLDIPNSFYDVIVFITPSTVFALGVFVGLQVDVGTLSNKIEQSSVSFVVLSLILLVFLSYEVGRSIEALSSLFVSRIIRKFSIHSDYSYDFTDAVKQLNVGLPVDSGRVNNKWTIYFYALLHVPHIGQDLLKRYAWEKLSRSSAFVFLILFITSLISLVYIMFIGSDSPAGYYGFGSFIYTFVSGGLTLSAFYEFYKRRCWNNDLLVKVIPVLVDAAKLNTSQVGAIEQWSNRK